jgi:hypothetical protein
VTKGMASLSFRKVVLPISSWAVNCWSSRRVSPPFTEFVYRCWVKFINDRLAFSHYQPARRLSETPGGVRLSSHTETWS